MPTVVIIHAAEDTLPARALAEKVRQAKLTVVLEKQTGDDLRAAIKDASLAIALWSPRAVSQSALIEDAAFARSKTKVLHASMQSAPTPEQFRGDKSVNLTGWRGEDDFAPWRELASLITEKTGVKPLPPPAPKPASGFFQPGRPAQAASAQPARQQPRQTQQPPQQQRQAAPRPTPTRPAPTNASYAQIETPKSGGGKGLVMAAAALVVVAAVGGGGYFFWRQSQNAETTSAAWESVERNDASALRAFIDGDPGEFRDEAETALAELEVRSFEAASDADSIEALEAFINDFPESEHAIAVRGRIAELRSVQQAPVPETPAAEETPTDPDLVPPAADAGPVPITPPPAEAPAAPTPAPTPTETPTN